ncbi:MBL fold metallo-hydrolase [Natrialbaceae archaeon GCM10025810]|uniref:MBL fold metallo-hydrolase n=1 Tax=Halovalidus salilacus TaxID=3075124 RepID=UPI00360B3A3B
MEVSRIQLPTPFEFETVNVYLLVADELTLIDTGLNSPASKDGLRQGLSAVGVDVADIDRVLVTHPHMDHFGLARWIADRSGAEVYAHEDATSMLADLDGYFQRELTHLVPFLESMGVPPDVARRMVVEPENDYTGLWEDVRPDVTLTSGDVVDVGTELTVLETPGHSPASISFLDREGERAFVGDHVDGPYVPTPLVCLQPDANGERTRSLPAYLDALERIRLFDEATFHPGHGATIEDPAGRIDEIVETVRSGVRKAAGVLRSNGPLTAYELHVELFDDHRAMDTIATQSIAIGYLDVLEDEGRVTVDRQNEPVIYNLG